MNRPTTVGEIDEALTECAKRLRLARKAQDADAELVYRRQRDRLLDWRNDLTGHRTNQPPAASQPANPEPTPATHRTT